MMGLKERAFAPLVAVSLEALVPPDHFYRYLQKVLDLSFVYDLVRESYAVVGRPSVDPVVFFQLQLVMFFEDIRSERLLMRQVADRLSVRWYVGYDLDQPLPDHSSLSKIRTRYGLEAFRRFFEAIVEQCHQAKLIWGKELYFDATHIDANAEARSPWYLPANGGHADQHDRSRCHTYAAQRGRNTSGLPYSLRGRWWQKSDYPVGACRARGGQRQSAHPRSDLADGVSLAHPAFLGDRRHDVWND